MPQLLSPVLSRWDLEPPMIYAPEAAGRSARYFPRFTTWPSCGPSRRWRLRTAANAAPAAPSRTWWMRTGIRTRSFIARTVASRKFPSDGSSVGRSTPPPC